jgi:carboxyl-terminal processing protease
MSAKKIAVFLFALCASLISLTAVARSQQPQMSDLERARALGMLQVVGNEVRNHYYDPKLHGVDWDAKVEEAKQKINHATSFNMAMSHIAAALDPLNDSHTFFLPPQHAYHHDFGWQYQMFGERCFVTQVRPNTDASAKGLKPGDEALTINGYAPTRNTLWKLQFMFSVLRPQPELQLSLRDATGTQRQMVVAADMSAMKRVTDLTGSDIFSLIREGEDRRHLLRARYGEFGDDLLILKVPEFFFSPSEVDAMIGRARKHKNLILDLPGNPGRAVETLKEILGGPFDKDIEIGNRVGRSDTKPMVAKASRNPFTGKLVVLVDSRSASAAELLARVVQIAKRGVVLGDLTRGQRHGSNAL